MSIVSIGSTLRFASLKLINQNECKIAINLMKTRQMSLAALSNSSNYNGNCYNNGVSLDFFVTRARFWYKEGKEKTWSSFVYESKTVENVGSQWILVKVNTCINIGLSRFVAHKKSIYAFLDSYKNTTEVDSIFNARRTLGHTCVLKCILYTYRTVIV